MLPSSIKADFKRQLEELMQFETGQFRMLLLKFLLVFEAEHYNDSIKKRLEDGGIMFRFLSFIPSQPRK